MTTAITTTGTMRQATAKRASWRERAIFLTMAWAWAMATLLAGCGGEPGTAKLRDASNADLTIWHGFEGEERPYFAELVKEFESAQAEKLGHAVRVAINYTPFPQMETKLRTATIAHETPDLCFFDALKVLGLAYGKALTRIDDIPGFPAESIEAFRSEFVPAAYDTCVVNVQGEVGLYGLPAQTTCVALFYNKAVFRRFHDSLKAAGLDPSRPPQTWDELESYAKAMTIPADGQYGWAMNRSLWWSYPMLNSTRAKLIEYAEDGKALNAFDDEKAFAGLALLEHLARSGFEGGAWRQGGLTPDQGFLEGKYAMCLNGPWKVADFLGAGLDFGVAPIPRLARAEAEKLGLIQPGATDEEWSQQVPSTSNLGGQNLVMFKTCPNKELALEFMLWFTSADVQRRWCSKLTQIPVRRAAREGLQLRNAEHFGVFVEQVSTTIAPPLVPLAGKLEVDIFNKELELLFEGAKTPQQAAAAIGEKLEKEILAKMNAF
jgi:multiple sugar transport system substrate-binding protein